LKQNTLFYTWTVNGQQRYCNLGCNVFTHKTFSKVRSIPFVFDNTQNRLNSIVWQVIEDKFQKWNFPTFSFYLIPETLSHPPSRGRRTDRTRDVTSTATRRRISEKFKILFFTALCKRVRAWMSNVTVENMIKSICRKSDPNVKNRFFKSLSWKSLYQKQYKK